jgi:hypothetical protein
MTPTPKTTPSLKQSKQATALARLPTLRGSFSGSCPLDLILPESLQQTLETSSPEKLGVRLNYGGVVASPDIGLSTTQHLYTM